MPKRLPEQHGLEDMRQLAAALREAHARSEPAALARVQSALGGRASAPLSQADAQAATAIEHGFASWGQLEAHVAPARSADDFLGLACLRYTQSDRPPHRQRAADMLARDPTLAARDIWHAACAGDAEAVAAEIRADASLAQRRGGCMDWEPLLYACYARLPGRSTLAAARVLLEAGADPNAHYMWGGQYRFTALTGAFGEGEMGPVNQPPHPDRDELARLLLDAGAEANDSQALYNTMFTPGSDCLETLLQRGLSSADTNNWLLEAEATDGVELVPHNERTLDYQLNWAVRRHHVERALLLLDHGADPNNTSVGDTPLYESAYLGGHLDLAEHLARHGATTVAIDPPRRLIGVCMAADEAAARALLAEQPDLVRKAEAAVPDVLASAATANRLAAVRTLLAAGFRVNPAAGLPLHQASFHGHRAMAELLLEAGADLGARDPGFAATPLQWAQTAGQHELAEYLASRNIGVFDAVLVEDLERIGALLDANPALLETTIGDERGDAAPHEADWQTPLAFACTRDLLAAARLLLQRGARRDVRDGQGRTLAERVSEVAYDAVLALLRQI